MQGFESWTIKLTAILFWKAFLSKNNPKGHTTRFVHRCLAKRIDGHRVDLLEWKPSNVPVECLPKDSPFRLSRHCRPVPPSLS